MKKLVSLILAGVLFQHPAALADTVADFIFDESLLTRLETDSELSYDHLLVAPESAPKTGFDDGTIDVVFQRADDGGGQVQISFDQAGLERQMPNLPTVGGNPLVMVFLESTARAMSSIAGGSPFYIRNRIKNALMTEGEQTMREISLGSTQAEVKEVVLLPFALDPNKPRMGQFGALEISFTYGSDVPGGIHQLRAFVPAKEKGETLYEERITFSEIGKAE